MGGKRGTCCFVDAAERRDPLQRRDGVAVRDERWLQRVKEPLSAGASNHCGTEYRAAGRVEASPTRAVSNSPRPGVVLVSARAATEG
jgi:hypothetical protein